MWLSIPCLLSFGWMRRWMPLIMELLVLVSQGLLLECLGLRWMLVMVKKLLLFLVLSVGSGLLLEVLECLGRRWMLDMLRKLVFFLVLLVGQ